MPCAQTAGVKQFFEKLGFSRILAKIANVVQSGVRRTAEFSAAPKAPRFSWLGIGLTFSAFVLAALGTAALYSYQELNQKLILHADKRIERIDRIFNSSLTQMEQLEAAGIQCNAAAQAALLESSLTSPVVKRFYFAANVNGPVVCSAGGLENESVTNLLLNEFKEVKPEKIDVNIKVVPNSYGDLLLTRRFRFDKNGLYAAQIPAMLMRDLISLNASIDEPRTRLVRSDGIELTGADWQEPSAQVQKEWVIEQRRHSDVLPISVVARASSNVVIGSVYQSAFFAITLALLLTMLVTMGLNQRLARQASVEVRLLQAIRKRQFEPVVQPIVDCETGRCLGGEVLMRQQHPVRGLIGPEEFLDVAEQTDLIHAMSMLIITKARDRLAPLVKADPSLYFTFNVTASQLQRPGFADLLVTVFDEQSLPPSNVMLELVERDAVDDASRAALEGLREYGFRVAIDDFGTGQSSLALVSTMQFDVLKIDKEFVQAVDSDSIHRSVLSSIADLAARLGVRCVAEGVETVAQHQFLISQGVDAIQGYLIAKPMTIAKFLRWYESNRENARYADQESVSQGNRTPQSAVIEGSVQSDEHAIAEYAQ
jgi:sensor c-di-GMP phosphodiesterase-like protein